MIKSPGNPILGLATVGSLLERSLRVATALLFSLVLIESASAKTANGVDGSKASIIRLTDKSEGRTFEGIGAVSAGASSRLLPDYPDKTRSQILDYLFRPKFGASFQHLKVEIGCGENSTCGAEPSHALSQDELASPKARGYEFWLMSEARKRNSAIILDCLPWGYPRFVGDRFSAMSAEWIVSFLKVAKEKFGLDIDWISAAQNENGTNLEWIVKELRPRLTAAGFSKVKLQAPDDDSEYWEIFDDFEKNSNAERLIDAVGYHYIDGREPWSIDQSNNHPSTVKAKSSGKSLWASEEWSQSGAQWGDKGALYLARLINKLYSVSRTTKFEIWCPIDSIYDQVYWGDTGVMQADAPWCGNYVVWPAVWAVAHTTQFVELGWKFIDSACGQFTPNTWRSSHSAYRNPKTGDWSLVICTDKAQEIDVILEGGLKRSTVSVWTSNSKDQFSRLRDLQPKNGRFSFNLQPESIYTFTSTQGQSKGMVASIPARKPFPFPYKEDFESGEVSQSARFFADMKGTFEIANNPLGGKCLEQKVTEQGILWYDTWRLKPYSMFGDVKWRDTAIDADVFIRGGDVEVGGRFGDQDKLGYRLILGRDGRWQLNWQYNILTGGQIVNFDPLKWHHLRLAMVGDKIIANIDREKLCEVKSSSAVEGMAFIASTYDRNLFDNISVTEP